MPHIQLELSAGTLDDRACRALLEDLAATLSEMESVNPKAVKAYARTAESWAMGEGAPSRFAHVTVCVLAGRDPALLSQISDALYSRMKAHFPPTTASDRVGLTLEVREMNPVCYRK